ncbi:hypothetical protein [Streptomyces sp. NPDC088789]|uniref:hypothetical protein n=1 Tax=Streptomyces sp. NPDC088789 TaxID=3365899 RepID=UPI00380F9D9F
MDQLPGRLREFGNYLGGLLTRLDQSAGWCGVFWQRDPEGMRACLDGREVPPWDVVESVLQDLATVYGPEVAAREQVRARALHAAALAAHDTLPGARASLDDRLDAVLREQRYAAARLAALDHALKAAASRADADTLRLDLAWARDDHARATARCAEVRRRIQHLAEAPGPRARGVPPPRVDGWEGMVGGAVSGVDRVDRVDPDRRVDRVDPDQPVDRVDRVARVDRVDRVDRAARVDRAGQAGPVDRAGQAGPVDRVDHAVRVDQVDHLARVDRIDLVHPVDRVDHAARVDQAERAASVDRVDHVNRFGRFDQVDRVDRVNPPDPLGALGSPDPLGPPDPFDRFEHFEHLDPEPKTPPRSTHDPAPPPHPTPEPARPGATPSPPPARKRRRGSARFAGMPDGDTDAAPLVVPDTSPPSPPTPQDAAPATPRGARFAGVAETEGDAVAPVPALDAATARDIVDTVRRLVALRREGRTGEAHALLVEVVHWPAERFPVVAGELERAGLGADWATLLWEAASLPVDRLVAAADTLVAAGRGEDGRRMLREGVARPPAEIGRAVAALDGRGRRREVTVLLDAYVRVRTPEDAARCARADPEHLVPLLLAAARAVSEERYWDLVHALRVAGFGG